LIVALIVRLATIAATAVVARNTAWCRRVALAGSIAASAIRLTAAARVLVSGVAASGVLLLVWLGGAS